MAVGHTASSATRCRDSADGSVTGNIACCPKGSLAPTALSMRRVYSYLIHGMQQQPQRIKSATKTATATRMEEIRFLHGPQILPSDRRDLMLWLVLPLCRFHPGQHLISSVCVVSFGALPPLLFLGSLASQVVVPLPRYVAILIGIRLVSL